MIRCWTAILEPGDWEVSDDGRIRRAGMPIVQHMHRGYYRVRINGRWRKVHALVLEAFVGPRPSPRHHAAHFPDRDRTNNRLSNLRWALPEENERDKRAHGTHSRDGHQPPSDENVVIAVRASAARGESFTRIGQFFDLHRSSVARIVRGQRRAT